MNRHRLSIIEIFTLVIAVIMVIMGYFYFYTSLTDFLQYVVEDGTVEWLTVAGLLAGSIVSFSRFFRLLKKRNWWFLTITFLFGLVLFFGAGEEISWGQRMLGIKSSEFFAKNNAQGETNLHNLVVDGVKLNKLIFTLLLGVGLAVYLLVVPVLYHKNNKIKNLLNTSGIPVPRLYQVISFVVLAIAISLIPNSKNAELLEGATALMLFLIIGYPKNDASFRQRLPAQ